MRWSEWIKIIVSCLSIAQMFLYLILLCVHETSYKKGFSDWITKNTTLTRCTEDDANQYFEMAKDYYGFARIIAWFVIVTVIFLFIVPFRMCFDTMEMDDKVCLNGMISFGCILTLNLAINYMFALLESENALTYKSTEIIKYPLLSSISCCSVHDYIIGKVPSPHKTFYELNSISAAYSCLMSSNTSRNHNGSCCCYDNLQVISVHTLGSYMDLIFLLFIFGLFFEGCLGLTSEDNSIELERTSARWAQIPKNNPKNLSCTQGGVRIECWLVLSLVKVRDEDGWYLVRIPDSSPDDRIIPIRTPVGGCVVIARPRQGDKIKSLILITVENQTQKQIRIGSLSNDGSFLIYINETTIQRNLAPEVLAESRKNLKAISCFDTFIHRRLSLHCISHSVRDNPLGYGDWIDIKFNIKGYSEGDSFRIEFAAQWNNETLFVIHMKGNVFQGFAFIRSPTRTPQPFEITPGQNFEGEEGPPGFHEVTLSFYRPMGSRIRTRRVTPEIIYPEFPPNIQIM